MLQNAAANTPGQISGWIKPIKAHELRELVNESGEEPTTVGDFTGLLEVIEFDGDAAGPLTGYWLLEDFDMSITHPLVLADLVPFTLSCAYLGDWE